MCVSPLPPRVLGSAVDERGAKGGYDTVLGASFTLLEAPNIVY